MADNLFQAGGVDALASTIGNWSGGHVPIATETVKFDATSPACTWDIATCPASGLLADWNMTGYANTLTPTVALHQLAVTGDVTLTGTFADGATALMNFVIDGSLIEGAAFSSTQGPTVVLEGTGTITWSVTGQGTINPEDGAYSATEQIECRSLYFGYGTFDGGGFGAVVAEDCLRGCDGAGSWSNSGAVSVGGDLVLHAEFTLTNPGTFTMIGTGDLSNAGAANGFPLVINTAGTVTAIIANYFDSFTLTAGTYAAGAFAHNIGGNLLINGGTLTGTTAIWTQSAAGDLANATIGNIFPALVLNGAATLTGICFTKKLSGAGSFSGASYMSVAPTAADFLDLPSEVAVGTTLQIRLAGNYANSGIINTAGTVNINIGSDHKMTQSGPMTAATLNINSNVDAKTNTLALVGRGHNLGATTLGRAAASDQSGVLDLTAAGSVKIASLVAGNAANLKNAILFGSSAPELSGTMNLTGVRATCTAGACHITGTGTLSNTDAASTTNGAPSDVAQSVVTVNDNTFNAAMVGRALLFTTSTNRYTILSVTNAKVCTVDGNANAEGGAAACKVRNINNILHCHGITGGGGNNGVDAGYVTFDTEAAPGSLALMGMGC